MRIHLITIITLATFMQVSGRASGQQVTLDLKNASLESAFKAIERQTSYVFFFPSRVVKDKKPVTLDLKQVDFKTAMQRILEGQGLTYLLSENSVIIKEARDQRVEKPAEDIVVRGRVTDGRGRPIPGATVKIKDTQIGTITDSAGRFSITVTQSKATLVISSVGYFSIQKEWNGEASLDVSLVESTAQLKEVTVTPINTGYEAISPERFVGSATVIDSTILSRSTTSGFLERLDGVGSGLLFDKSAGSFNVRLNIRGVSTLAGGWDLNGQSLSNPLIILDDFPYTGSLQDINPNDIASVAILKDAAATSVWGAKAGNGVLVIKTNKGRDGAAFNVNVSSNFRIHQKPDLSYFPLLNSTEFIEVERFLFDEGYQDAYLQYPDYYIISPAVQIMDHKRQGKITADEERRLLDNLRAVDIRDQYRKYIYRNSSTIQNYVSVSGSANRMNYLISGGADNSVSNIKGPGRNDRYTFNSALNVRLSKIIDLQSAVAYTVENNLLDAIPSTLLSPGGPRGAMYPYAKFADETGSHLPIAYKYTLSYLDEMAANPKLLDWHYRPLDELDFANNKVSSNYFRGNLGLGVQLLKWAKLDVKYQYTSRNTGTRNIMDERTFFTRDLINRYTDPTTYARAIPTGGILDQGASNVFSHNARAQLSFSHNWNTVHSLTGLLAFDVNSTTLSASSHRVYGYDDNNLTLADRIDYVTFFPLFQGGRFQIPSRLIEEQRKDNLVSTLANVSYSFKNRYTLYASARRDGSNIFGVNTNNKWKPLWSVGGKYRISEEPFFAASKISNMALRASYGYTGNVNNTISALATIGYASNLNLDQQRMAFLFAPPNPDLRWEQVKTTNLGIDVGLFDNRLSVALDYYVKKSSDVIAAVPIDPTLGAGGVINKNVANLRTKGVDVTVHSRNLDGAVSWNTGFNYSYAKTVVTKFFQNFVVTPNGPGLREGDVLNAIYAYKWAGLDAENGDPVGFLGKERSKDYDRIFLDSVENQAYVGSGTPLHFGNLLNTIAFRNFDLSFNISFRAGYYFRKPALRYDALYDAWVGNSEYANRWKAPGDEKFTNVPSRPFPANSSRDQFYEFSEVNYEPGDHVRLQDVRLGYTWVNKGRKLAALRSVNIFALADNLNFMIWKASGLSFDPDFPTSEYPPQKAISVGVKVSIK